MKSKLIQSISRIILSPLTIIYYILIRIKNFHYDYRILKRYKYPKPVISIGNISAGGTGKTPFVIHLAKTIMRQNRKIAIISRGYKRKSKGLKLVYDGKRVLDWEKAGDEMIMIYRMLKEEKSQFYLLVCKDRFKAIDYTMQYFKPDVVILDDAFSRRRLFRDMDIVLIDSDDYNKNKITGRLVFPIGNLREPFCSLRRADYIIQNDKFSEYTAINRIKNIKKDRYFRIRYTIDSVRDVRGNKLDKTDTEVIAFCGIANPYSFNKCIEKLNFKIKSKFEFPDHHYFSSNDIEKLKSEYTGKEIFLTTEKDFVRLEKYENFLKKYPVYFVRLNIEYIGNKLIIKY